jgi:hypothetical protein
VLHLIIHFYTTHSHFSQGSGLYNRPSSDLAFTKNLSDELASACRVEMSFPYNKHLENKARNILCIQKNKLLMLQQAIG